MIYLLTICYLLFGLCRRIQDEMEELFIKIDYELS